MAAWGGVPSTGAWANQVEEEEEENGGELDPVPAPAANAFPALGGDPAFPALGEAINIRDSKKDRKKKNTKNTMSLGAFVAAGKKEPEIVNLPTGPRQRSAEEEEKRGGLGGGFKNYGGDRSSGFERRDRERDEDGFGAPRDEEGPSRADAADDWGTKKAFVPSSGPGRSGSGFGDRERSGGFGERDRGGGFGDKYSERRSGFGEGDLDRADTAERWGSKSFEPSSRSGGFGDRDRGGFGDRDRLSDRSRDRDGDISRADTEDKWSRRAPVSDPLESRVGSSGGSRPRLALQPRNPTLPPLQQPTSSTASQTGSEANSVDDHAEQPVVVPRTGPKPNPFGAAKPVDVKEKEVVESVIRANDGDEKAEAEPQKPAEPRPRSNPFGAARPREEVLKEKGLLPSPPASAQDEAGIAPPSQAVQVTLDPGTKEETIAPQSSSITTKDDAEEARQDETVPTERKPIKEKVEAVTNDLSTKVNVEHDVEQKAELAKSNQPASEQKPAVEQPAETQSAAPVGMWAKIAARPAEDSAKQGIET